MRQRQSARLKKIGAADPCPNAASQPRGLPRCSPTTTSCATPTGRRLLRERTGSALSSQAAYKGRGAADRGEYRPVRMDQTKTEPQARRSGLFRVLALGTTA